MADTHPLWIEQLDDRQLQKRHLAVLERVVATHWRNPEQVELLEQLLFELRTRMDAE